MKIVDKQSGRVFNSRQSNSSKTDIGKVRNPLGNLQFSQDQVNNLIKFVTNNNESVTELLNWLGTNDDINYVIKSLQTANENLILDEALIQAKDEVLSMLKNIGVDSFEVASGSVLYHEKVVSFVILFNSKQDYDEAIGIIDGFESQAKYNRYDPKTGLTFLTGFGSNWNRVDVSIKFDKLKSKDLFNKVKGLNIKSIEFHQSNA